MIVNKIIEGLENFYNVWSNGPSGDVIKVQKKLADIEILSVQTAKKIIKEPTLLRIECNKETAEEDVKYFEEVGLKCKVEHVGKKLLDQYSEKEINTFLSNIPGGLESAFIKEIKPESYELFSENGIVEVDVEEIGFYFYLSCLRYLAKKGKVKT